MVSPLRPNSTERVILVIEIFYDPPLIHVLSKVKPTSRLEARADVLNPKATFTSFNRQNTLSYHVCTHLLPDEPDTVTMV